jgi:hypothetical protein
MISILRPAPLKEVHQRHHAISYPYRQVYRSLHRHSKGNPGLVDRKDYLLGA